MRIAARAVAAAAVMACALPWGGAILAAPGIAGIGQDAPRLAAHRAVYEMTLAGARSGSGVTGVSGRMVYEFSGSPCEGYTLNMRLVTQIADRSGESVTTDLRSSTWEDGEGRAFRFTTSNYTNDRLVETTRGAAARAEPDGPITVQVEEPAEAVLELPSEVLFPTQHSLTVLAAAAEGRTLVQAPIFDGSERAARVYATTAFIGPATRPGAHDPRDAIGGGEKLAGLRAWPITIGYFDQKSVDDATPAYELAFRLYANGVSRDLSIDYGDFVIRGAISSLDFLPAGSCP